MAARKQILVIVALTAMLVILSGWFTGRVSATGPGYYHQVQRNIELFGRVYQEISRKYVEEIDPGEFMKAGIEGMLATLDPYTVLVEKEDNQELQIMSSGKYGGLGMRIGLRGGWPTVVEPPFDGTPSTKAGIREGDRIIEIDAVSTKGLTINKVASMLRGDIGSEVFLKIERAGEITPIEFRLIRAEIIVTDVIYSGIIESGIGLIRLSHFSRNAGKDIEKSIRELKKGGLRALILDLRSNPGGLLDAAVKVSENFLEKGTLIVSTEGRSAGSDQQYLAAKTPILGNIPLVVLVNGLSASASEIVAGAIQDHDRGVIIGSNSFGKGLVQTVIPITSEAALKVTTARYLVPSGRSIQDPSRFLPDPDKILYKPPTDNSEKKSDEETELSARKEVEQTYHTAKGREVLAAHGITPDIIIEQEQRSQFEIELLRKTMPFQFSVMYAAQHPELQRGFEVTDEMLEAFRQFLKEKGFIYKSQAELALQRIEKIAQESQYLASISASAEEIRSVILEQESKAFGNSRDFIQEELEEEISAKLWGSRAETEASIDHDETIQKAMDILADREKYDAILTAVDAK